MLNSKKKLLLKTTEKPTSLQNTESSSSSSLLVNMEALRKFQREYSEAKDFAGKYKVLRVNWLYVGKNQPLPDLHQEVLSALIGYRYIAEAYLDADLPMPKQMAQNLEALERQDMESLTPNMARMMKILTQTSTNRGEEEMKKVKKEGQAPKEAYQSKHQVSHLYLEIFENQAKAQLRDEQIIEAISKKTGEAPTAKNVASYRCMYNAGKLQGQKVVPALKVKAVRAKKEKAAKKPMSEETKAKLKAYTAKKKAEKAKAAKKK